MKKLLVFGFVFSLLISACVRQVQPEPQGVDHLVLSFDKPAQRQAFQAFAAEQGLDLKQVSAAGGRAEYQLDLPEDRVASLRDRLTGLGYRVERREHALILVCCQP